METLKKVGLLLFMKLSLLSNLYGYTVNDWKQFDGVVESASVTLVHDTKLNKDVFSLNNISTTQSGGFKLDGLNIENRNFSWKMKYVENFVIYIGVETTDGYKYLKYSSADVDGGLSSNQNYIHHGLRTSIKDGKWHTIQRDLQSDLSEHDSGNTILTIKEFRVLGSGLIYDINEEASTLQVPKAIAKVSDLNVTEGVLVTFDANSSYDRDGTILSYEWKENDIVLSNNKEFSSNTLTVGTHTILLTVMDDDGLIGTDIVVVTVEKLTNQGVSFHTAFMSNYDEQMDLSFFISAKEDTTGEIKLYDTNEIIKFSVLAGDIEEVSIPRRMMLSGTSQEKKVIGITSQKDIIIVGLSKKQHSTDAFLVLPDKVLSNEYYALTYGNTNVHNDAKEEFAIVATEDNTIVNITLPNNLGSFSITLAKGETYQYQKNRAGNWLTGTYITSNKKVALLGGNSCTNIPQDQNVAYCDHVVEQILPMSTWENKFITVPLKTRKNGDTFRILASKKSTEIKINGVIVTTLNAGEYYETVLENSSYITH